MRPKQFVFALCPASKTITFIHLALAIQFHKVLPGACNHFYRHYCSMGTATTVVLMHCAVSISSCGLGVLFEHVPGPPIERHHALAPLLKTTGASSYEAWWPGRHFSRVACSSILRSSTRLAASRHAILHTAQRHTVYRLRHGRSILTYQQLRS